jgi:hypothetical protein
VKNGPTANFIVMNATRNCASRLFLILALICASWVTTTVGQPPSTLARNGHGGGRLIVQRAADFGWNLAVRLQIDGRTITNIVQGRRYDGFIPAGRHVLTVSAVPNNYFRPPMSMLLKVQPGHMYVFTAVWDSDRIVLRPSMLPGTERFYFQP